MKIQELAIIFIIIILPISLLLSEYTQFQIKTINLQTQYDSKLTDATYDAIRAFQLNSTNSTTADLSNSKIRDIEASVNSFRNSIMSGFELNGYTKEALDNYIPALVYTFYDGFYIYSPYKNTHDESGNAINKKTEDLESIYGLKPYISYSCRYQKGSSIDVVITYALDNYITVQGNINGVYVNESGYLIEGIGIKDGSTVEYNGVTIEAEQLKEYIPIKNYNTITGDLQEAPVEGYKYAKISGIKYYWIEDYYKTKDDDGNTQYLDCIVSVLNGTPIIQAKEDKKDEKNSTFAQYQRWIENNRSAMQYYIDAENFTSWFKTTGLKDLTYNDAVEYTDGTNIKKIWEENYTKIFEFGTVTNIENELSNFNQHRLEVIRHKIETNLSIAISNYNKYSKADNVFQMPELKETEWEHLTNNVALISFLQGLPIGGKIYNGYTIVTNSENSTVILEESLYLLGSDKNYHKIGDNGIANGSIGIDAGSYHENSDGASSAGRLNLDFRRTNISQDGKIEYYYPLQEYKASYKSIVMQDDVTTYDDIYKYIKEGGNEAIARAFYTALARERYSQYKSYTTSDINAILGEFYTVTYDGNGGSDIINDVPTSQTKIKGKNLPLRNGRPRREGYEFNGWKGSDGKDYAPGVLYVADKDLKLEAKWLKVFTVTYNTNGGQPSSIPNNTKKQGENLQLSSTILYKTGYEFKGWKDDDGTLYARGGTYKKDKNTTMTAQWEPLTYTITFDANGGSGGPGIQKWKYDDSKDISTLPIPTKVGHIFFGWSTSQTGDPVYGNSAQKIYTVKGDETLYAVWAKEKFIITYDANGGLGGQTTQEGRYDSYVNLISKPSGFERAGYIFKGWSVSPSATIAQYSEEQLYQLKGNVTLYAVWESRIKTAAVGAYVKYSANGYDKWRIMYNNDGQLDLVSEGSVTNVYLEGNGDWLNAVLELNNKAKNYVTGLATSARSIGCTSSSTPSLSSGSSSMSGLPYNDTYYTKDVNQLKAYNMVQTNADVWLASREVAKCGWLNFGRMGKVRVLKTNGEVTSYRMQEYYITGQQNRDSKTQGFRPVVSFPSGLQIVGGDGTSANPYVLSN